MKGMNIRFGIDGDRANAKLFAGSNNAEGDFAAVSDEDLFNHGKRLKAEDGRLKVGVLRLEADLTMEYF